MLVQSLSSLYQQKKFGFNRISHNIIVFLPKKKFLEKWNDGGKANNSVNNHKSDFRTEKPGSPRSVADGGQMALEACRGMT